jgi:hypothetical protein
MTTFLPYRARVYCSLGELIGGQFADTYLQQAGLIFCRGTIELAGIYRPDIGAPVDFAYTRGGSTAARIPRRLRVLSSFADPFTKRTTVQVGCKLSLMQETRKIDKATPEQTYVALGPSGGSGIQVAKEYLAPPIAASVVANQCLTAIGVTPAAALPLLNFYTSDEIDLSAGYVQILGLLLESELYVGWMNEDDQLEVRNLQSDSGALGPTLNATNCFALSPIGTGALPAEEVSVIYEPVGLISKFINESTPSEKDRLDNASGWNNVTTYGSLVFYRIDYAGGTYVDSYNPVQTTVSDYVNGQVISTTTTASKPYAAVAGKYASQALSNGLSVPLSRVAARTVTTNQYDDQQRQVQSTVTEYTSLAEFAGTLDLTYVFSPTDFVTIPTSGSVVRTRTVTTWQYSGNLVRRSTSRYVNWALSQNGQQAINASRENVATSGDTANFVNAVIGEPAYEGEEVTVSDSGPQTQRLPRPASLTRDVYGKTSVKTREVATSTLSFSAITSETGITFALPFTGHDYFNSLVAGQWQTVDTSERTRSLALNYGRIQNRLRLGNAQGVSLQVPVELLPTKPFDALYLQADGLTGQYRANGMSWTFDSNGIVGQVDALFWLATGQAGTPGAIWFPMPPGVSTLPTTPTATVNGSPAPANSGSLPGGWDPAAPDLTALFGALPTGVAPVFPSTLDVETGLEPFNETVALDAVTRSVLSVVDVPFSLVPQSDAADMVTHSLFVGAQIVLARVPASALTFAAFAPAVYAPAKVVVPAIPLTMAALAPAAVTGSGYVPVPLATLTLATLAPTLSPISDPDFASVSLLLPLNGTNGSTTFTDASSNAFTVTGSGNAQISTAQSQWGGSSLLLDGTGDFLTTATDAAFTITGDFTVEFWIRVLTTAGTGINARSLLHINAGGGQGLHIAASATSLAVDNGLVTDFVSAAGIVVTDAWGYHSVTKSGTTLRIFSGGTLLDTRTAQSYGTPDRCQIGRYSTGGVILDAHAHYNAVRITKGVARYTASYSPPAAPFPTG